MNYNHRNFTKKISFLLVALLIGFNTFSLTTRAAEPTIQLSTRNTVSNATSLENTEGKTTVADLRIDELEEPISGKLLDNFAKVRTSQGFFWNIPVIWLGEAGEISSLCIPGKKYAPIFAFYIPDNYIVIGPNGSSTFSVKLPDFVEKLYAEKHFLSVVNPLSGITYITTPSVVRILGSERGAGIFNSPELKNYTSIARMSSMSDLVAVGNAISSDIQQSSEELSDSWYAHNNYDSESGNPGTSANQDEDSKDGEWVDEDEEEPLDGGDDDDPDEPDEPQVDLVAIHCSQNIIDELGRDIMSNFLNLIINVVEPQAVYWLKESFSSYGEGAANNALGKEIGLYIYDSRFKNDPDKDKNGVLAYVSSNMNTDEEGDSIYGYYVAVNTESLYEKTEDGSYELKADEIDNLNNTLVHEMMHAFMDDYTRTGMEGYSNVAFDYTADENKFPTWFIEGSATSVDNVYAYRNDIFCAMHTDSEDALSDYTIDSLLGYYKNYNDEEYGSPSIDSSNKYYDSAKNAASAYVSGYLACLYLADLAVNKGYVQDITTSRSTDEEGNVSFSSSAIKGGFDAILGRLHDGYSLDSIITDISDGKYTSTESFQNAFLTGTYNEESRNYENYDDSATFCVDFLNYLNRVSKDLTGDSENVAFANGSILLDFSTELKSPFSGELPDDMPQQSIFTIADSSDHVTSTVDNDVAWHSAGVKGPAAPDNDQNDEIDSASEDEGQIAARVSETVDTSGTSDEAVASNSIDMAKEISEDASSDIDIEKEIATEAQDEASKESSYESGDEQEESATDNNENKVVEDAQCTPTVTNDQTNITDTKFPVSNENRDESVPEDPKPQLPDESQEDNNDNESDGSNDDEANESEEKQEESSE